MNNLSVLEEVEMLRMEQFVVPYNTRAITEANHLEEFIMEQSVRRYQLTGHAISPPPLHRMNGTQLDMAGRWNRTYFKIYP